MHSPLQWLAANPYVLLFVVVLLSVLLARVTIQGQGLGLVASTIVVGAGLAAASTLSGIRMGVDEFARSLFFYLFAYGLGLRVGPALANGLRDDGPKFALLAVISSLLGLAATLASVRFWDLPPAAAGGLLAGAMTMSAAVGAAEEAVFQGAFGLRPGQGFDDATGMIALSYGITYLCGSLGLALACRYLPRWWGIDLEAEARRHEERAGVPNVDDAGLTGMKPVAVRAYRVANDTLAGLTVRQFLQKYPQYLVLNVLRVAPARTPAMSGEPFGLAMSAAAMQLSAAGVHSTTLLREVDPFAAAARDHRPSLPDTPYTKLGAADELQLRHGDIVTLGGRADELGQGVALLGPEVTDPTALNIPLEHAQIVVTRPEAAGRELAQLRNADYAGQVAIHHVSRGGVPMPLALHLRLQRFDVLCVAGVKGGVERMARQLGKVVQADSMLDLLLLSLGLCLGLLLGAITFPIAGARAGLGNSGGLLVAGILVSAVSASMPAFGRTPDGGRNLLEDLGLAAFVAIVAIDAGTMLASLGSAELVTKLLVAGLLASMLPPVAAWAIGLHAMKINPAILVGAVAGARSHAGPARAAAREIGSSVPWIGFPVAHAVSVVLATACGYFAMILAK
jgi:putative transport protein